MSKLQSGQIQHLRPTQLTIGKIEVEDKRARLAALKTKDQSDFLEAHPIPAVIGPDKALYITDHHHLARAALEAGVNTAFLAIEADLGKLSGSAFWQEMDKQLWVHPLDENGVRHHYAAIPRDLVCLVDDVYRSLAGYVRDAGGYKKTQTAFAEFIWADYFRRSVAIEDVLANFHDAVATARRLARSPLAKGIPGFIDE
jgi:hypothetical protein